MRNKRSAQFFHLIFGPLVVMAACTSASPTMQRVDTTPSPTPTLTTITNFSPTVRPTSTYMLPPATPVPSFPLPPDDEVRMTGLLQSEDCKLPCYLGITPGKTNLNEAKAILESLGATHHGDYKRYTDGAMEFAYDLNVGEIIGTNGTANNNPGTVLIYHSVSLITNNDTVQIIEIGAGTSTKQSLELQAISKFREIWSRYTSRGIFLQSGQPDKLFIGILDPSNMILYPDLLIIYQKLGTVIDYYGTERENNICLEDKAQDIYMRLSLFNPNSNLRISDDGRVPPTDRRAWLPINEILGVNESEFYNQVISNPSICFNSIIQTKTP